MQDVRPPTRGFHRIIRAGSLAIVISAALGGCAADRPADSPLLPPPAGESDRIGAASETPAGAAGVVALVNGQPVRLEQMLPALKEAAGAQALDEIALDVMLADEARRAGVTITDAALADERELFIESLYDAGLASRDQAAEAMLLEVRRARGLGPVRFNDLLRRTATLRALIRPQVQITDEMIALAHAIEHGEKYDARIIATSTLAEAQRALDDIRDGASFAEAAARRSTDVSAARGGVIEPLSPLDPTYPESVRTALTRLRPGQTSPPLIVDSGYAIVRLEDIIPADGVTLSESRERIRRRVQRQEERRLMAGLADRLRRRAQITVLDPALQFQQTSR